MLIEQEHIPFNMVVMHRSGPWGGGGGRRQLPKAPAHESTIRWCRKITVQKLLQIAIFEQYFLIPHSNFYVPIVRPIMIFNNELISEVDISKVVKQLFI